MEASSATQAVDPDRLTIQYFEKGGANPQTEQVVVVEGTTNDGAEAGDARCATFSIKNEDHTIGNALRHIIMKNPDVEFCSYSIPHPSEHKIHFRIQSNGPAAIDILKKGLDDLKAVYEGLLGKFQADLAKGDYEKNMEVEV